MNLGFGSADTPSRQTLATSRDLVFVVEHHPVNNAPLTPWRVVAFDVENGVRKWETSQLEFIDSLAASSQYLFVASSSGIKAHAVSDGHLIWTSNQPPPEHEGYDLFFDELQLKLIITGGQGNLFSTIDTKSGLVDNPVQSNRLVAFDTQYRYKWNDREFWLEDAATNTMKWVLPVTSTTMLWPLIEREQSIVILPAVTSKTGWHTIVVVDRDSGKVKWQCSDCLASDVAVDGNTLFAILRDGSLAAYDLTTGGQRGVIRFPGDTKMEPLNNTFANFWQSTSQPYIWRLRARLNHQMWGVKLQFRILAKVLTQYSI